MIVGSRFEMGRDVWMKFEAMVSQIFYLFPRIRKDLGGETRNVDTNKASIIQKCLCMSVKFAERCRRCTSY